METFRATCGRKRPYALQSDADLYDRGYAEGVEGMGAPPYRSAFLDGVNDRIVEDEQREDARIERQREAWEQAYGGADQ